MCFWVEHFSVIFRYFPVLSALLVPQLCQYVSGLECLPVPFCICLTVLIYFNGFEPCFLHRFSRPVIILLCHWIITTVTPVFGFVVWVLSSFSTCAKPKDLASVMNKKASKNLSCYLFVPWRLMKKVGLDILHPHKGATSTSNTEDMNCRHSVGQGGC